MDHDPSEGARSTVDAGSPAQVYLPEHRAPAAIPTESELLHRPAFGIRAQLTVAFTIVFTLAAVIAVWNLNAVSRLQERLRLLEVFDSYLAEIQQTRRFEKDFLLYETNMEDTWSHLEASRAILRSHRDAMVELVGEPKVQQAFDHTQAYAVLLDELEQHGLDDGGERPSIEPAIREHGSEMVSFALALSGEQRRKVDATFRQARRLPLLFLVVLLATVLAITAFLSRRLIRSFTRFAAYTERVGRGDFSPIRPLRPYRDEFTQLALAFNHMIAELDRRHDILVESHKMRAIGDLVAGVAHEINNPLNNIFLTAAGLIEDYDEFDDGERVEMAEDVMKEAERAQRIVRNLLDFARQREVQMQSILLDEVLRQSAALVSNQLRMAKISLVLEVPPGLPPVHGDPQMLSQVIVNLVLNARDALSSGGQITLSVRGDVEEDYLAIVVHDDGHGIPEHVLPRIFEPFFTTKKEARGTGLGLSVSQGIVKKLGGVIRVRSEVGQGTDFIVLLPKTDVPFEDRRGLT